MRVLAIMTALITTITSNGCVDRYRVIHEPLELGDQCIFEKLTEDEKSLMSESTKRKLGRNYKGCFIRHKSNRDLVESHNELHK